jgi:hypothetical protein
MPALSAPSNVREMAIKLVPRPQTAVLPGARSRIVRAVRRVQMGIVMHPRVLTHVQSMLNNAPVMATKPVEIIIMTDVVSGAQ